LSGRISFNFGCLKLTSRRRAIVIGVIRSGGDKMVHGDKNKKRALARLIVSTGLKKLIPENEPLVKLGNS
jgi:hypothetical protein